MKKFATFATASVLALTAGLAMAQDAALPSASEVVATVNGTDITLGHMIIARAQLPQQYQQLPADVLWDGLLDQLIQQQLLADTLTDVPARAVMAVENEARSINAGEVIAALSDEAITDEALQAAYDARFADAAPEVEFHASHILVATEDEAKAVIERLNAGEDFAAVATEVSQDPGSANGGDLGWFGKGMMVPEFENAVIALEVGALSAPVQSQFGWHVIKLAETRDKAQPTLDELRGELSGEIQAQAIEAKITELTDAGEITRPEEGAFDPAILTNLDILEQ